MTQEKSMGQIAYEAFKISLGEEPYWPWIEEHEKTKFDAWEQAAEAVARSAVMTKNTDQKTKWTAGPWYVDQVEQSGVGTIFWIDSPDAPQTAIADLYHMHALGAHIQADAYRDTFLDNDEDAKYLRKQETYWRLMSRGWLSADLASLSASTAKDRALLQDKESMK